MVTEGKSFPSGTNTNEHVLNGLDLVEDLKTHGNLTLI